MSNTNKTPVQCAVYEYSPAQIGKAVEGKSHTLSQAVPQEKVQKACATGKCFVVTPAGELTKLSSAPNIGDKVGASTGAVHGGVKVNSMILYH